MNLKLSIQKCLNARSPIKCCVQVPICSIVDKEQHGLNNPFEKWQYVLIGYSRIQNIQIGMQFNRRPQFADVLVGKVIDMSLAPRIENGILIPTERGSPRENKEQSARMNLKLSSKMSVHQKESKRSFACESTQTSLGSRICCLRRT